MSAVTPSPAARAPVRVWLPNLVVALGATAWAWRAAHPTGVWPVAPLVVASVAVSLLLAALFAPRVHAPVQRALDAFGRLVLQAFTWLILGLVFALIFVPGRLGLLVFGRDPLARKRSAPGASYWQKLPPAAAPAVRFTRQF